MADTDISITGAGCLTPLGHGPDSFGSALAAGRDGISEAELPPGCRHSHCLVGRLPGFQGLEKRYIPALRRRRMTRLSRMAAVAAGQALEGAGLLSEDLDSTGLVLGTAFGSSGRSAEFFMDLLDKGSRLVNPGLFPETVPNAAAGQVAILYGLRGPNCTVCEQAVSSEAALGLTVDMLRGGMAERFLVIGVEEISPVLLQGLDSLGLLKPVNGRGREEYRPSGRILPGEAAAALVVEAAGTRSRRSRPLARILDVRQGGQAVRRPKYFRVAESLAGIFGDMRAAWKETAQHAIMGGSFLDAVDSEHWSALAGHLGPGARAATPEYATGHLMGAGLLRCLTAALALQGLSLPWRRLDRQTATRGADFGLEAAGRPLDRILTSAVSPGGGAAVVLLEKE